MKKFDDIKNDVKYKFETTCSRVKYKAQKGVDWVKNNPEKAITIATVGVGMVAEGRKVATGISKAVSNSKANHEIYNPSTHRTVRTKKAITPKMDREIARRQANGEMISDILVDMGLI